MPPAGNSDCSIHNQAITKTMIIKKQDELLSSGNLPFVNYNNFMPNSLQLDNLNNLAGAVIDIYNIRTSLYWTNPSAIPILCLHIFPYNRYKILS